MDARKFEQRKDHEQEAHDRVPIESIGVAHARQIAARVESERRQGEHGRHAQADAIYV